MEKNAFKKDPELSAGRPIGLSPKQKKSKLPVWITFIIMFAGWLVLSGKLDFFHLFLGIVSSLMVALYSGEMLVSNPESGMALKRWLRFVGYIPWLLYQIFLANIHVMYLVFHPKMMKLIDPEIIEFRSILKNEMALLTFANSITLTPGTITVYTTNLGTFRVHVIDKPSGESLPGKMEERIAQVFGE